MLETNEQSIGLPISLEAIEADFANQFLYLPLGTEVVLADSVKAGDATYPAGTRVQRYVRYVDNQPYACGVISGSDVVLELKSIGEVGFSR